MPKHRFVRARLALGRCCALAVTLASTRWRRHPGPAFAPPASKPRPAAATTSGRGTRDRAGRRGHLLRLGHAGRRARRLRPGADQLARRGRCHAARSRSSFPTAFARPRRVITTDRTWDLAALAIWRPNVAPVQLAARPPQPGEPLTIAGYGSGSYRAVTGTCTQYVAPGDEQAVRDGRTVGCRAARRFRRPDLQQPRRTGRRPVGCRLGNHRREAIPAAWPHSSRRSCRRQAWARKPNRSGKPRHATAGALVPVQYNAPLAQVQRPDRVVADQQSTAAHASIARPRAPPPTAGECSCRSTNSRDWRRH